MKYSSILTIILSFLFLNSSAHNLEFNSLTQSDTLKKGKNYILFSKTKEIESVRFVKNKKATTNSLKVHFGLPPVIPPTNNVFNSTMEVVKKYKPEDGALFVFDKITILSGKYDRIQTTAETNSRNLLTFTGLEFPLRLNLIWGKESVDLELTEAGEWDITIEIKNN